MYVGYVVFLDGNPKKLPQTGRDIPRSVLRVRCSSYSASSNVLTIHAGSAFFLFFVFVFLAKVSNFSGSNENPNTRKKEDKKKVLVPKKKKIDDEHKVVGFAVLFVFFVFLIIRKISRLFLAFVFQSGKLFLHNTILTLP